MFDLRELAPKPDPAPETAEPGNIREMPAPVRAPRPVTNLGKVFGQFAHLQQQLGEQLGALEDSVIHQREEIAADLPEMKQKINWLIASFYEQSRKDEEVHERIQRNEVTLAAMQSQIGALTEANTHWQSTIDQMIDLLMKARAAAPSVPA